MSAPKPPSPGSATWRWGSTGSIHRFDSMAQKTTTIGCCHPPRGWEPSWLQVRADLSQISKGYAEPERHRPTGPLPARIARERCVRGSTLVRWIPPTAGRCTLQTWTAKDGIANERAAWMPPHSRLAELARLVHSVGRLQPLIHTREQHARFSVLNAGLVQGVRTPLSLRSLSAQADVTSWDQSCF